MNIIIKVKDQL